MLKNLLVSDTHSEPSNEELGIKPWSKRITYPALVAVGLLMWAGIAAAF